LGEEGNFFLEVAPEAVDPQAQPLSLAAARELQESLRHRVRLTPLARPPQLVGGADAICDRRERLIFGAVAVFTYPELELVEEAAVSGLCPFPYRTGLLSFREVPILTAACRRLRHLPDLLLVDGQGIAHPRGLGLASHLGLVLDRPTLGVAKSRLLGEYTEPDEAAGSRTPLIWQGKEVGLVVRTRTGVRPLYVSSGHRCSLRETVAIVLGCLKGYRLPEPLRRADWLSRRLRETWLTLCG
jgi:deoxyribonuclease V